jgi:hypothetical protein
MSTLDTTPTATLEKHIRLNQYLVGEDNEGTKYWLDAPSWDCDWYWGFGYIGTKDSHQHADGKYGPDYPDSNLFTGKFLVKKTFTENEGWKLRELFATFYQLRKQAELVGRGGMHVTTNPLNELLTDKKQAEDINKRLLPAVMKAITDLLTPVKA